MASNIKNQLFSGVFYTALAKYSGIVISLVIAGILARLLSPDDFGIVAVATVIIAFFSLLTDMGISPAINCCPLIYSLPPPPSCREHYSIGTRNSNSSLSVVSLSRFPQVRQP